MCEKSRAEDPTEIPELPSEQTIDRLVSLLEPYRRVAQPKFYGIENLPDEGSLLVGNHSIYGFLDLPFMMAEVWESRRIAVRGLGEHATTRFPSGGTCSERAGWSAGPATTFAP